MSRCSDTWSKFKRKAFVAKSLTSQMDTSASGNDMSRVLGAVDLTFMGIGGIIGAGVFVLTGVAARDTSGCDSAFFSLRVSVPVTWTDSLVLVGSID
jgi:APA family basic amino acid/polyamine antiporter